MAQIGQCFSLQMKAHMLYKGAESYLSWVRKNLAKLPGAGDPIPPEWEQRAQRGGLTPDNAYLHFRGHNMYDLVCHIGMVLCRCSHSQFEDDVLLRRTPAALYPEQEQIQKDLESF